MPFTTSAFRSLNLGIPVGGWAIVAPATGPDIRVPFGGANGIPYNDANGNLNPSADGLDYLGVAASRWAGVQVNLTGGIVFNDGAGNFNFSGYQDAVGPAFRDRVTGQTVRFNVQALTGLKTITVPNGSGTMPLTGNSQAFVPTTGGTVAPTNTGAPVMCFINPAGTLATLTLTLPTGLFAGQTLYTVFTQIITALTVTAGNIGSTGRASPSSATATSIFAWSWNDSTSKWDRFL